MKEFSYSLTDFVDIDHRFYLPYLNNIGFIANLILTV